MPSDDRADSAEPDHPGARRMAVIAFLNQNITIACVWGSFSVLLLPVEARLGVGRELSTLAVLLCNLATALCAPLVGIQATRGSLRRVMLIGSTLSMAGFVLLALTHDFASYLAAYALLLGPGMAVGAILPATLVTRWFSAHRGRVLGIVSAPIVIAAVPLLSTWTVQRFGVSGTYAALAAMSLIPVLANVLIVDRPPTAATSSPSGAAPAPAMTIGLLRSPVFAVLALGFIASVTGSVVSTAHMVPMAREWGYSSTMAATLLSVGSTAGIFGTILFGWAADRLGGTRTLTILVIDAAVLWLLLLAGPPLPLLMTIIALICLHGAGAVPAMGVALSERFGKASFGGAYGLANLVNLPFSVLCVPAAAVVFTRTGSYHGVILGEAAFLAISGLLLLILARRRSPAHDIDATRIR